MKPHSVKYVDVDFYETSFCIIYPPTAINHKENWLLRLEAAYTDKTSIKELHNILQTTRKVKEQAEQRNFPTKIGGTHTLPCSVIQSLYTCTALIQIYIVQWFTHVSLFFMHWAPVKQANESRAAGNYFWNSIF